MSVSRTVSSMTVGTDYPTARLRSLQRIPITAKVLSATATDAIVEFRNTTTNIVSFTQTLRLVDIINFEI